jgi:hypothetical protein
VNARDQGVEPLDDHRPLLEDGGFEIEGYDTLFGADNLRT